MNPSILLLSPPFTQLNTPYPATAYIKGFFNTQGIASTQMDLGIETMLALFSRHGLESVFETAANTMNLASPNALRIFSLRTEYENTIETVIRFLQDEDPTLMHFICERNFLPEASRFDQLEDLEWAFGTMGIRDQARHIATLYLEDIGDFISELVDPYFGFSRYAERLGLSAKSFDELYAALNSPNTLISDLMLDLLEHKIAACKPEMVCMSVPFPGNLFAALKCGQWLKKVHPQIKIVMGGGYPNTELRSLSDERVFDFLDFICLDDGEAPLLHLLEHLGGTRSLEQLKRTFTVIDNKVQYCNGSKSPDIRQEKVGTPDYSDLPLKKYLSVIEVANPMHRLWSDGRWNKLTMAHGCYWGKCTFCDISLDYIKNYESATASTIVDRMETLIAQTGNRGFHFVDEAAPPALMKSVAQEILKRKLIVNWWTNIRFEKSFHYDLCRLLAASGCVAVSGGLEVASDRLLGLIDKGVTVEQVTKVTESFNRAGIMVHAYLMYGFPTQTAQETIDSLEVVRQMFETNILQSAFWHRFAMTAHSPVGIEPQAFDVVNVDKKLGTFANNDLTHADPSGADHGIYSEGLKVSLYNYMRGAGLDLPLQQWFEQEVPETTLPPDLIENYLKEDEEREIKQNHNLLWLGGSVLYDAEEALLIINSKKEQLIEACDPELGMWLEKSLNALRPEAGVKINFGKFEAGFYEAGFEAFEEFWTSELMDDIRAMGLLVL